MRESFDVRCIQILLERLRLDLLIESVLEIYLQDRLAGRVRIRKRVVRTIFCKGYDFQNRTKFAEYLNVRNESHLGSSLPVELRCYLM